MQDPFYVLDSYSIYSILEIKVISFVENLLILCCLFNEFTVEKQAWLLKRISNLSWFVLPVNYVFQLISHRSVVEELIGYFVELILFVCCSVSCAPELLFHVASCDRSVEMSHDVD
jgi:hypothetical protein